MVKNKRKNAVIYSYDQSNMSGENNIHRKLKALKLYLMSRDIKRQLKTVEFIMYCLKHPKDSPLDVDLFLIDDIPGLLCDIMNNHDSNLIRKVFDCLKLMTKSSRFYKERHAMIVLETTMRTLKILIKDITQASVIKSGLKLLHQILPRLHIENASMFPKLLSLVRSIMSTSLLQPLHLNAVVTLQSVMKELIRIESCHCDLLYVFQRSLEFLGNATSSSSVYVYTTILSDILCNCLRLCFQMTYKVDKASEKDSTLGKMLTKVKSLLWENIKNIISKSLINSDIKKCSVRDVDKIIVCLFSALSKLPPEESNNLAHHLAVLGYLVLLPKINVCLRNEKLIKHSNTLMSELLSQLCVSTLKIGKFCKKEQFRICINKGIQALSIDTSLWTQALVDSSSKYAQYTVVIYMYFMLLSHKSTHFVQAYRVAVCSYLTALENPIPLPILKSIWFIYAITSLHMPPRQVSGRQTFHKASRKLIEMLKSQKNLKNLYTHHPAVIYWLFKSNYVDRKIQCTVMNLWCSDDSKASFNVMLSLVLNCHLASLCLFEVIRTCTSKVAETAIKILNEVISRDKANGSSGLSVRIWENLPQILSRSSFSTNSVMNVNYILYLASQYVPSNLDIALLIRLSIQVNNLITRFSGPEECYRILRLFLSRLGMNLTMITVCAGDYTILKIFLDSNKLIRVLTEEMSVKYSIVNSNLQFLGMLIHCQHYYGVKSSTTINMNGGIFQQLLTSRKLEEVVSTLAILPVVFDPNKQIRPFIVITEQVEVDFIQTLFYQLQMLCTKGASQISKSSWKNQHLLLKFCSVHKLKDLELHLATHPFTHLALQDFMLSSSSTFWKFVKTWLESLQKRKKEVLLGRQNNQSLCRNVMSITLTGISEELLKKTEGNMLETQQDIVMKILSLNENIPQDIVKALTRKALDFNQGSSSPERN